MWRDLHSADSLDLQDTNGVFLFSEKCQVFVYKETPHRDERSAGKCII